MWECVYHNDYSILKKLGYTELPLLSSSNFKERRIELYSYVREHEGKTIQLESALCLEKLQAFKNINSNKISFCAKSYEELEIPQNSVIYCDPPYYGSTEDNYSGDFSRNSFDKKAFCDWAKKQTNIFISEYDMSNDFKCIWHHEKIIHSTKGTHLSKSEKLFIPNI